jgi:tight adherence protein B
MAVNTLQARPEYSGILRDEETFYVDDDPSMSNNLNGWFDTLMAQSGLGMSPTVMMFLSLLSGIALGGAVMVWQENPLSAAFAAFVGFLIPIMLTTLHRQRRQTTMMAQMPPMIDELARAAKTGRSIDQCVQLVANDTPAPLGDELRVCSRRLSMGLPMNQAMEELPYRTGLVSSNVLVTALSVHQQTGGDLVKVLERLAVTIRDRIQFQGRLRAATAASRYVAFLMVALPPAILAFFMFRDPNYIQNLMNSQWGQWATMAAFVLEVIGVVWVLRILATSNRS